MTMTRKDYENVAEVIKIVYSQSDNEQQQLGSIQIAYGLAEVFVRENSRFDYTKFYKACGVI